MSIKILVLGEIVGSSGVYAIKKTISNLKKEKGIDFIVANGEGTTSGFGLGQRHSLYLKKLGIDLITIGEKGFFKKDLTSFIKTAKFILRPANYPPGTPGLGWKTIEIKDKKITFISMLGMSGFERIHLSNPFSYTPQLISKLKGDTDFFVVDFHASTTAEKNTMFHLLDGKASIVYGTHSKAITADAKIMPQGTGVISDTGRCGSLHGIGGLMPEIEIDKFMIQIPKRSKDCFEKLETQGALFEIDNSGRCINIETLRIPVESPSEEERKSANKF
ncbi:MAG: YmdB family metallophosphoesterase [Spirochaetales bacterium]|nr:YmdB family metallophosphoesterase [Spirochaetales bacterium]